MIITNRFITTLTTITTTTTTTTTTATTTTTTTTFYFLDFFLFPASLRHTTTQHTEFNLNKTPDVCTVRERIKKEVAEKSLIISFISRTTTPGDSRCGRVCQVGVKRCPSGSVFVCPSVVV